MHSELESMSLQDLCDLLIAKSYKFLELIEDRNQDGHKISDLSKEIDYIKELVNLKKKFSDLPHN